MYNDVVKDIIAMNGKVVQDMLVTSPDYGIVPKFGMTLNCTAKEIVTDLFIVSFSFLFRFSYFDIFFSISIFFIGRLYRSGSNS